MRSDQLRNQRVQPQPDPIRLLPRPEERSSEKRQAQHEKSSSYHDMKPRRFVKDSGINPERRLSLSPFGMGQEPPKKFVQPFLLKILEIRTNSSKSQFAAHKKPTPNSLYVVVIAFVIDGIKE
uniref:Uncharacterized protein n=1 Tax=Solanum lycopersicum TaxID=4081 RepID=A0A3Q7FKL6_SOLLC